MIRKMRFKILSQGIFYVWISIASLVMVLSGLKNMLGKHQFCGTKSISHKLSPVEIQTQTESHLENALKGLNESIHSAQLSAQASIEPPLVEMKQARKLSIDSGRCLYQEQSYLPGDLLKQETGWMRCHLVNGKAGWVEVK